MRRRILLPVLLTLAVVVAGLLAGRALVSPVGGSRTVIVQVPRGASAGAVAQLLAERGAIRSAFGLKLLARITGKSADLKPGAYRLNTSMSPAVVMNKIARGDVYARWVTFPEGYTIRQIGERLQEEHLGGEGRFRQIAGSQGGMFATSFQHPSDSLEGYLFPDSYLIPVGAPEETMIRAMLSTFESKVTKPLAEDIAASGMSLHQIVTLASLIEREARVARDRPLISAVLRNRLRENMLLECDATVLYALGRHKERVLYRDLAVDSPHNTYLHPGLPPGPIANPGLASIEAALHPANADYLFYVARPDGSHIFSRTFAEHQHAIQAVRRDSH